MRGTHRVSPFGVSAPGIIPADAGNTLIAEIGVVADLDHPRGCGEHDVVQADSIPVAGSSPRMRGTHVVLMAPVQPVRIIPADAGNTCFR